MSSAITETTADIPLAEERHWSPENPNHPIDPGSLPWGDGSTSSGDPVTARSAISSSAVLAAVNLLARTIGQLPFNVVERFEDGSRRPAPDHPLEPIISLQPNREMHSQVWREQVTNRQLLHGSGQSLIDREDRNNPDSPVTSITPIHTPLHRVRTEDGAVAFMDQIRGVMIRDFNLYAIPCIVMSGGAFGLSPIELAPDAVGTTLAAQRYRGRFFRQGGTLSGILKFPKRLGIPAAEKVRADWERMHAGDANAYRTAILEEGIEYEGISTDPDKGQVLETSHFQVLEVARLFGVPPHMIAELENATFSNIEAQGIDFVTYALGWMLVRWEMEARIKLFSRDDRRRFGVKLNTNALLRGDAAARSALYTALFGVGSITPNEIRSREDLPPIDGGDTAYIPLNLAPTGGVSGADEGSGARTESRGDDDDEAYDAGYVDSGTARVAITTLEPMARRWLDDAAERACAREASRFARGIRGRPPAALREWLADFYDRFRHVLEGDLVEPAGAYASAVSTIRGEELGADLAGPIDRYIERALTRARAILDSGSASSPVATLFPDDRVAALVEDIIEEISR